MTFTLLVIVGTIFSLRRHNSKKRKVSEGDLTKLVEKRQLSFSRRFLASFDLQENFNFATSMDVPDSFISSINGLRAVTAVWIVAGHSFYYAFGAVDNLQYYFTFSYTSFNPMYHIATSAALAVDMFFVFSGFLLSYSFFERQKTKPHSNSCSSTFKRILSRYLQLNPTSMIVSLVFIYFSSF